MLELDKENLTRKITLKIIEQIKNSGKKFTEDEIKNKINNEIEETIREIEEKESKIEEKIAEEKEDSIIKEFMNLKDDEDNNNDIKKLTINNVNDYDDFDNDIEEESGNDNYENNTENELNEVDKMNEDDKFILNVSNLYKKELKKSSSGFGNFLSSFSFLKKASMFEKILILIFLMIPALFGGVLSVILIILLFLFWQIDNILKLFIKFFEKFQSFFKNSIITLKKKISEETGGFFKKLLLSAFLYSIIMINGIFYILIKGIMIPFKSLSGINKIISNLIAKLTNGVSGILKAPSQLAITDLEKNALMSGKTNSKMSKRDKMRIKVKNRKKGRTSITKSGFILGGNRALKTTRNNKLDLKDKSLMDIYGNAIFNSDIKYGENNSNLDSKKSTKSANLEDINKINKLENRINELELDASMLNTPSSLALSNKLRKEAMLEEMKNGIFENIANNFEKFIDRNEIKNDLITNFQEKIGKEYSTMEHHEKILQDIHLEKKEKMGIIDNATNNLSNLGYKNPISLSTEYRELREKGVEHPASEILKNQNPNWNTLTKEEKFSAAISLADTRVGQEDLRDLANFQERAKENKNTLSCQEHLEEKLQNAKADLRQEHVEFKERYGYDCQDLLQEEMKNQGIPSDKILNDREFKEVAVNIVQKFPEEQQIDMLKDLREHSQTYKEARECEKELKYEKNLSAELAKQQTEEKNNFVAKVLENVKKETEEVKSPNEMTNVEKVLERRGGNNKGGMELSL